MQTGKREPTARIIQASQTAYYIRQEKGNHSLTEQDNGRAEHRDPSWLIFSAEIMGMVVGCSFIYTWI